MSCDKKERELETGELKLSVATIDFGRDLKTKAFTLSNVGERSVAWRVEKKPDWVSLIRSEKGRRSEDGVVAPPVSDGTLDAGAQQMLVAILNRDVITEVMQKDTLTLRASDADKKLPNDGKIELEFKAIANRSPTGLSLTNVNLKENLPKGTLVGTLSSTDPNADETFTYALVSGAEDADNASFTVVENRLLTASTFDYETKTKYKIRLQTQDLKGKIRQRPFTIAIENVVELPENFSLSDNTIEEGKDRGTPVGNFSASSTNPGETFSYTFNTAKYPAHQHFSIGGTALSTADVFARSKKTSYEIAVWVQGSKEKVRVEKIFEIRVVAAP